MFDNIFVMIFNFFSIFGFVYLLIYKAGENFPDKRTLDQIDSIFDKNLLERLEYSLKVKKFNPRVNKKNIEEIKELRSVLSKIKFGLSDRGTFCVNRLHRLINEFLILFNEEQFWTLEKDYYVPDHKNISLCCYGEKSTQVERIVAQDQFKILLILKLKEIKKEYRKMREILSKKWVFGIWR